MESNSKELERQKKQEALEGILKHHKDQKVKIERLIQSQRARIEELKSSDDPSKRELGKREEAEFEEDTAPGLFEQIKNHESSIPEYEAKLKAFKDENPIIKREEEESPPIEINGTAAQPIDVDELDLLKPKSQRAQLDVQRTILVTKTGPRGKKIAIVQYGPQNAAIYRREDVTDEDVKDIDDISDPGERPGQKGKYRGGKFVFDRSKKDVMAVQGIAFEDSGYGEPIEELNPATKGDRARFPPTDVLIKWNVNGVISTSWETRTVFRRLWWNNKKGAADKDLYLAAQVSEERFKEWQDGKRMGSGRSPTPIPEITARIRARSLEPTPSPAASSPPSTQNQSLLVSKTNLSTKPLSQDQKQQWIQAMCEMMEKPFDQMSMEDKARLTTLWIQQLNQSQ